MDELQFWKQKLVQFFHDPPSKPFQFFPNSGGHLKLAKQLFKRFSGETMKFAAKPPDLAASGADRAVLGSPQGTTGRLGNVSYHKDPFISHPLSPFVLLAAHNDASIPTSLDEIQRRQDEQLETLDDLSDIFELDYGDPYSYPLAMLVLWRRFRDELIGDLPKGDLLWERMPADSRCPDHSIWEHLKVTTALAFLVGKKAKVADDARCPWLFTMSIGPVQSFIAQSRTSRDLWISSMLLSDLAWHAMLPIVEQYGPEAIMYPDLRGNPRVDVWLAQEHKEALPEFADKPSSFAAMLPHTFTAILPRGGEGRLMKLEELARKCDASLQKRWMQLANCVRGWMVDKLRTDVHGTEWQRIWDRQIPGFFHTQWNAVPWLVPEQQKEFGFHGALPCQDQSKLKQPSDEDASAMLDRSKRLSPWLPPEMWSHYEAARNVFGLTNKGYLQTERGFDYALTHHQLRMRHGMRKQAKRILDRPKESGEKCSLMPEMEALWDQSISASDQGHDQTDLHKNNVREFWKSLDEDKTGAERLSAVAAVKRFLVEADQDAKLFNHIWAGPISPLNTIRDSDGEVRVPFPSTATIAAQQYLVDLAARDDLEKDLIAVTAAVRRAGLPRTSFPRSLPRLAAASHKNKKAEEFLKLDTQTAIFPDALQGRIRMLKDKGQQSEAERLNSILGPVDALEYYAKEAHIAPPATRFAVIRLDADQMGRLLLGDPERMGARWRDVIHPEVVKAIPHSKPLVDAGWVDLLDQKRLVGPSLHAFISRALADFAHHIVPWVVEREFGGRLIYAGGDDVLALAPADDALPIAARLQQLFSAAWVIDTKHTADAWEWRRHNWKGDFNPENARKRFRIPERPQVGGPVDFRTKIQLASHVADRIVSRVPDEEPAKESVEGRVLALLGPQASLSASIVYAHYKTPLGDLLRHTGELLEGTAKGKLDRSAVALSHYSRNGVKTEIGLKWKSDGAEAHRSLSHLVNAFRDEGSLAGRLPYKLREVSPLVHAAIHEDGGKLNKQLLTGFVRSACENKLDDETERAVLHIWSAGFHLHEEAERAVDGLLLCRALASNTGDDE